MSIYRRDPRDKLTIVLLIALIIGISVAPVIFGVDEVGARRVLESSGYTNITITGYKWFNGTKEFYNTGFEAIGPNGGVVSGNVSKGLFFKGSTIRLD